jgi:hypothetical protein
MKKRIENQGGDWIVLALKVSNEVGKTVREEKR